MECECQPYANGEFIAIKPSTNKVTLPIAHADAHTIALWHHAPTKSTWLWDGTAWQLVRTGMSPRDCDVEADLERFMRIRSNMGGERYAAGDYGIVPAGFRNW